MSTECFPYDEKWLPLFATTLPDPAARLRVMTRFGPRYEWFLVDTGADVTLLPASAADYFALELLEGEDRIYGIEGAGISIRSAVAEIEILGTFHSVRCAISDRDDIPFLLGRLDVLDRYDLLFLESEVCFRRRGKIR